MKIDIDPNQFKTRLGVIGYWLEAVSKPRIETSSKQKPSGICSPI